MHGYSRHITSQGQKIQKEQRKEQRFGGILNCFTCHIDRRCKKMNQQIVSIFVVCYAEQCHWPRVMISEVQKIPSLAT